MSILLRDVMNSKSDRHFRHPENAYNIKKLSFYYAIESRIFNGIWDEENQKYKRGPLWFTNLMVFDFDYDTEHYPDVKDYEKKLNESLEKLESILGTPKYKIYNKQKFTKWEEEVYFTKNGKVKLPKKYGCQVVYELSESLQSQFVERVKLYNSLRLHISSIVDSDMNFKGHMFKNLYNTKLFNIQKNKEFDTVDIFKIATNLGFGNVEMIKELNAFETLESKNPKNNKLPNYLNKWNNMLFGYYQELNSWKSNNTKVNWKNKMSYVEKAKKSDSRNETLFEYFKSIPLSTLETITYGETISKSFNLFDSCVIKDPLDETEWEATRQSVLAYRKEHNIEWVDSNVDNRVFKWVQNDLNLSFFDLNEEKFNKAKEESRNTSTTILKWLNNSFETSLFEGNSDKEILANVFLTFGPEKILSNIRNLISPKILDFYKNLLNENRHNGCYIDYGMYDLYCIIKDAIYLTHFKYYGSIQEYRKSEKNYKDTSYKTKAELREELFLNWGLDFNGNILGFKKFYNKLKKNGLLKEDGMPLAISFYQNHFHIRNTVASIYVKIIKKYLKTVKSIKACLKDKKIKNVKYSKNNMIPIKEIQNNCGETFNFSKNSSRLIKDLIKSFNIYDKLFNNKDSIRYLYYNKIYCKNNIFKTHDNNYNYILNNIHKSIIRYYKIQRRRKFLYYIKIPIFYDYFNYI